MALRLLLVAPALALLLAFFLLPLGRLVAAGWDGRGAAGYVAALTEPRYLVALRDTVLLSAGVALASVALSAVVGGFLARHRFPLRRLLVALLTLPLAFPGVVFAYSLGGLALGYLYFSLPRCIATVMAAAEGLDPALEEAARTLGAGPWRVARDVILPGLAPALVASGAIVFATCMGALGTAFTLAADIRVLPMVIYTEFTLATNFSVAAALSVLLGTVTWAALATARLFGGGSVAAQA